MPKLVGRVPTYTYRYYNCKYATNAVMNHRRFYFRMTKLLDQIQSINGGMYRRTYGDCAFLLIAYLKIDLLGGLYL